MENFTFHLPTTIRFGEKVYQELPEVLATYGKRVLLVYGGGSIKRSGLYDEIQAMLAAHAFTVFELADVEPNPQLATVEKGIALCRAENIDVILPIGGGSVIDCSKAVAAGTFVEGDIWSVIETNGYDGPALPLVTVLTIAATGSEMNGWSVISNKATNQKLEFYGESLLPKVSFLDPTLTVTVPTRQTAAGGIDSLSHLMENYFNRTPGTFVQDRLAEGLMKTVVHYLPIALAEPTNYEARANLMWTSTLALNGLTDSGKTGEWSCHPIEHELSAFYDLTHGIGLAIITPRWMDYVLNETNVARFATFARNVWDVTEIDDEKAARLGIERLVAFFEATGVPLTLPEAGITETTHFQQMAEQAVRHSALATDVFVPLTVADVQAIYEASMVPIKKGLGQMS